MEDEALVAFHERLYYHELDNREKLIARLQLCLAILSSLAGFMIYLFAHLDVAGGHSALATALLLVFSALGSALLVASAHEYICALWNHHYQCLPFAVQIEEYRQELAETYKDYGELSTAEYQRFLRTYLAECASSNAQVNAKRYEHCHNCLSYIVYSLVPIAVSGSTFVVGGFMKGA